MAARGRIAPRGLGAARAGWRVQLATLWAMSRKQLIVMARYPVEFVGSFVTVFLIIAMFTLAALMFAGGSADGSASGSGLGSLVAYGLVLFLFLQDACWQMGAGLRREQVEGTLEALYLSPASKFASLLSRVAVLVVWDGLLGVAAIVFLGALVGRVAFYNPLQGLAVLLFSIGACIGIGILFAAFALVAKESVENAVNFVQFGAFVLCAMYFPFSALPAPVLAVSRLIPFSYCVDLLRSTFMDRAPELAPASVEWPIVVAFGLLMPLAGYWLYRRAEHHVRTTGGLSQY